MSKTAKKRVLLTVKLVVAAGLLVWVFSKAHWSDYVQLPDGKTAAVVEGSPPPAGAEVRPGLRSVLADIHWGWFAAAVVAPALSLSFASLRWGYLCRRLGIALSHWQALKLGYLGQFFNMVVPGTVGGDLVKVWYVHQSSHKPAEALVSVFVDRLVGMVELVLMAAVMLAIVLGLGLDTFDRLREPVISVAVIAAISAVALALLLSRRLRAALGLERLWRRTSVAHHFEAAGKSVQTLKEHPRILVSMLLQTVGTHIVFVGGIGLIGVAMGLQVPFWSYFVYLPLIYVIGAIPITPGGVGLIEGLYVGFFTAAGNVGASQVIAMAMVARILPMLWGLLGIPVLVTGPRLPKTEDMQSELEQAEEEEARGEA